MNKKGLAINEQRGLAIDKQKGLVQVRIQLVQQT